MKKIISVMLAGLICLGMAGCSNNGQEENADTLHKTISIVQNNNQNRITTEDENYIYFYNVNKIMKMSKADNSVETIYTFDGDNMLQFYCIEYFNGALYMIGMSYEPVMQLATIKTDGRGMNKVALEDKNQMPNFYTYKDKLYLDYFMMGNDRSYTVTPDTLELEPVNREPSYQHHTADGSTFIKTVENNCGRLYKTDENDEFVLFLQDEKSVFFNHITDYYVFYILIDPVTFEKYEIYRCDLKGNNSVLIKEISAQNMYLTYFDSRYLYVGEYKGPVWKIDKETLETTDISTIAGIDIGLQEVNNEKFFYSFTNDVYCIDTVTGEKTEF